MGVVACGVMLEMFGLLAEFRVHSCLSVLVGMEWKRREVVCVIFICLCATAVSCCVLL